MDLYKVILVDDEADVIESIQHKIKWNDLGFEVVGSATNGIKALELAESIQPDVVLTDIKMPYMDGLELSKQLNNEYPNIHIMICTGFDEFEYAKEAVHLDINEYILKPVSAAELTSCLIRLKEALDREREEKLNVKKLKSYFNDVLPALRANLFVSLIEGRSTREEYDKFIKAYKVDIKCPLFCCVEFHTSETNVPDGMDSLLLSMSVEREIKERIVKNIRCQEFIYLGNTVLIVELENEKMLSGLTDMCNKFCKWAYRVMGAVVTAGIGRVCDDLFNINLSYSGAREAVSYRVLYGTKRAINISEIVFKAEGEGKAFRNENNGMHELFKAIHIGDIDKIEKAAKKEVKILYENAETINQYNLGIMEMIGAFYRFCANNFMDFNELSGIKKPYDIVPEMDESALTIWVTYTSAAIGEKMKRMRNNTSRRFVANAENIVKERYMEADFSLDTICQDLGVSNSYFSSEFKKATGKSFITYLTDYRMDVAVKMMIYTNAKNSEIAEKVGYLDANYFSYVFKKKFKVSPSKYRSEMNKN